MEHYFYIRDAITKENVIDVYQIKDHPSNVYGERDRALTQFTRKDMREMLNATIKMLGDSDYQLNAILVVGSRRDVLGYELIIRDENLAMQFKLAYC